ncbi:MAG: DUF4332 domain-containing protein [Actinobacteria bacterium]|nr:DUF4332 domain-containing protein [Actinomycetota bacterium]
MYSTDLTSISLGAFEETILTIDLLPSRKLLAEGITGVVAELRRMGIDNLEDLQGLLRDKERYAELAASLSVNEMYLTVLKREVNSYVSKPVSLSQLDVFEEPELERLRMARIRSTKDLYERCALPSERRAIAVEHDLDGKRLARALELSDLVRINGVGPAFAHFLSGLGVQGPRDFNSTDPLEILERYRHSVDEGAAAGPQLRLEDLEYCGRFSLHLSNDIER